MERKVILYIAMSLDGYIAKNDDNIDFLSIVETPNEDFGYADFLKNIDTVIWGRRTFDKVLTLGTELPHKDKNVFVVSRTRQGKHEHVTYHDDVVKLVSELKQADGSNIYCDGGSEIIRELLQHALVDQLTISIIPHLLGDGIRLFRDGRPEQNLKLKRSIAYPCGLVQVWYDRSAV